jgi:CDGSH-type Zn-finger protein
MAATKITVGRDGAFRVEGDFEIVDGDGKPFGLGGRARVALCRCGHSSNRPFCDGSHNRSGFDCHPEAFDLPPLVK